MSQQEDNTGRLFEFFTLNMLLPACTRGPLSGIALAGWQTPNSPTRHRRSSLSQRIQHKALHRDWLVQEGFALRSSAILLEQDLSGTQHFPRTRNNLCIC